jgi:tryptophanyl-tRNA synthetase
VEKYQTSRYKLEIEEIAKGGPGGYESTYLIKEGENAHENLYTLLEQTFRGILLPANNRVIRQRNAGSLIDALNKNKKIGIASGFKPSGAYHFGHKSASSTLAFFQRNGAQVFVPVADVECQMAKEKPEQYFLTAADNLVDWGANGVNLDASHVYLQSEESRVFSISYKIAPKLEFGDALDIYGAKKLLFGEPEKGKPAEFPFIFSGITQVADILLPQHKDFGNNHSFMVSGPDQDGHMKMAILLTKRTLEDRIDLDGVGEVPSSFYIPHIRGLTGDKASSSKPETTIYLGSGNPIVLPENKNIVGWRYDLDIDERVKRNLNMMDKALKETQEALERCTLDMVRYIDFFHKHSKVSFKELCGSNKYKELQESLEKTQTSDEAERVQNQIDQFLLNECKSAGQNNIQLVRENLSDALKDHQRKRQAVLSYAVEKENYRDPGAWTTDNGIVEEPSFWEVPDKARVDPALRNKTQWFNIVASMKDKIIP